MYKKNKNLGQHFLKDEDVLTKIIRFLADSPQKTLYEIGPGAGALTSCLISHGWTVRAIEIDKRWCQWLEKKYDEQCLSIFNEDALKYSWDKLVQNDVIVGNLPYHIASELMCLWVYKQVSFYQAILMMQKEVADRVLASPGSKHFGRLSIVLQTYFKVEDLLSVPPESFDPPPKVQSSIIKLSLLSKPLCSHKYLGALKQITAAAFNQRRKKCKHGLAKIFSVDDLIKLGIDPELRPEFLNVEQFIILAKYHENRN